MNFTLIVIMALFILLPAVLSAIDTIEESENRARNFIILIAILCTTLVIVTGLLGYFGKL